VRRVLALALLAGTVAIAADKAPVPRQAMEVIERGFDKMLAGVDVNDPFDIIGMTRGLYLDGFGIVFTTETNLVISSVSPFARTPNKEDIAKLRQKKAARLEILRNLMRQSKHSCCFPFSARLRRRQRTIPRKGGFPSCATTRSFLSFILTWMRTRSKA
jgi:hypothetical protein